MTLSFLDVALSWLVITATALGALLATWRFALRRGGPWPILAAGTAVLAWLGLAIVFIASKTRLLSPEEFLFDCCVVGFFAGMVIGRWGAVLLPTTLWVPSVVFDVVRHATASGIERYDPRPPFSLYLLLFVLPAACFSVAGGVALRKRSKAGQRR